MRVRGAEHAQMGSLCPWPPPGGRMRAGALHLAEKLCEALRGEEDTMVETLLQRGADPNLVLPEGIAAIHLAAGMEQESGIRCLHLILQYGGDPNVRSVEDLTPLHVAASWGCYTCLRLLLMEGGNARLEDQDGNTALDLALEQGNEMCVRILQSSLEETGKEQSSWMPERRAESFLSTITEGLSETGAVPRLYDSYPSTSSQIPPSNETLRHMGPCSSFPHPIVPALKSGPKGSIPANCEEKSCSLEDRFSASFLTECSWRCSTLSEQWDPHAQPEASSIPSFSRGDASGPTWNRSAAQGFPKDGPAHRTWAAEGATPLHYVETTTRAVRCLSPDLNGAFLHGTLFDAESCTSRVYPEIPNTTGSQETPRSPHMKPGCKADRLPGIQGSSAAFNLSQDSSFLDPDLIVKLTGQEGLDVTSPDHAYIFSRANSTALSDLEKTVVDLSRACVNPQGSSARGKPPGRRSDGNSSGRPSLSSSECYVSAAEELCCHREREERKGRFGWSPGSPESSRSESVLLRPCRDLLPGSPVCSTQELFETSGADTFCERISPARSESPVHLQDGTGFREASSTMSAGRPALDLCSNGKKECAGNMSEPGLSGMSQAGNLAKGPSPKWKNQEQDTLSLQEPQKKMAPGAENKRLPEGSSDERVATRQLQGEFRGAVASPEALAGLAREGRQRGVQESGLPATAPEVEGRKSQRTRDTVLIPRASGETKSFPGSESPELPTTTGGMDDTVVVSRQAVDDTMVIPGAEEEPTSLEAKLRSMMFATRVCHSPLLQPNCRPGHVTPRTKSRAAVSATRSSSSSLFDDTLEMPSWPRQRRGPKGSSPASREAQNRADDLRYGEPPSRAGEGPAEPGETQVIAAGPSNVTPDRSPGLSPSGPSVASPVAPTNSGRDAPRCVTPGTDCSVDSEAGELPASEGEMEKRGAAGDPQSGAQCGEARRPPKPSRVSFSRMPGRGQLFAPGTSGALGPASQGVPLSPGGRPVNLSAIEPVEHLYVDEDEGLTLIERHVPCSDDSVASGTGSEDTIIYNWQAYVGRTAGQECAGSAPLRASAQPCQLSDEALARKLRDFGVSAGPVTGLTRKVYLQLLEKLMSDPKAKARKGSAGYSPELSSALEMYQIPDGRDDEMALARQFDQPDKSKRWREGVLKSSFNYLLLDPRVTQNLPFRCQFVSQAECFRTFISAVFYVGKGKRSRPYSHLYEALTRHKGGRGRRGGQACSKVRHILEIWASGEGVISMHCFQNVIPVEAYTREACMLDAIGLKMLTNQKKGDYYGVVASWPMKRRRYLGIYLLQRAMQIFLAEGERQLRPADI